MDSHRLKIREKTCVPRPGRGLSGQDFINACRMCGFKATIATMGTIKTWVPSMCHLCSINVMGTMFHIIHYFQLCFSRLTSRLCLHTASQMVRIHLLDRADLIHGSSSTFWTHLTYRAKQISKDHHLTFDISSEQIRTNQNKSEQIRCNRGVPYFFLHLQTFLNLRGQLHLHVRK